MRAATRMMLGLLGPMLMGGIAFAGEMSFRRHAIDAKSAICACAVIDVNRDGKVDVVSGESWYEAPSWKSHSIRKVAFIRGRYDDYSHLQLDVNRDGFMDFVTANFRSQKLAWIQNPGPTGGEWKEHVIATPGPMETGRLEDVDGDGQLDILPNGAKDFAAWWEVAYENDQPKWIRHDLPEALIGHGIGIGDINGDGRRDLICPRGWFEAPENRRTGRWSMHEDFQLHRDGSIPMLVVDVDADGDNDIVYGRGHNTGLYWVEQTRKEPKPDWVLHAIDTSWSQAHTIHLVDLDGDGKAELIAGKRHLGHDGRDLGEYDTSVIYWYRFDPKLKAWQRGLISEGTTAALGLDPKTADLDGDGDIDLVASDRGGLFWFENLLKPGHHSSTGEPAKLPEAPTYADHSKLLLFKQAGEDRPVTNAFEWGIRRAHILAGVERAMGPFPGPERRVPLEMEIVSEEKQPGYVRQRINFSPEPGDRVPAYLLLPEAKGRRPAMLCLHQTTKIGKGEPAGLGGLKTLHYAHELASRGYVCLVPDYPSFGDYQYDFSKDDYVSGSMKAIWNNIRGIDLLESLSQVDPDRIGCIGHSLGGHNSIFTAAFDLRIKAVVSSCGFNAFHHYYDGKLAGWTSDRYMPRIREVYNNDPDKVPFDFYGLFGAIAPRHYFVNAPLHDSNFEVTGVKKVLAEADKLYPLFDREKQSVAVYPDCGHDFPDDIRKQAYDWLDRVLR